MDNGGQVRKDSGDSIDVFQGNGEACEPSDMDQKWVDDLNESVGKAIAELRILEDTCMFMCLTHPGM